jgi:hypothetical protein
MASDMTGKPIRENGMRLVAGEIRLASEVLSEVTHESQISQP